MRKITLSAALLAALTVPALAAGNTLVYTTSGGISGEMVMTADGTGANRTLAQVCEDTAAFLRTRGFIASCK